MIVSWEILTCGLAYLGEWGQWNVWFEHAEHFLAFLLVPQVFHSLDCLVCMYSKYKYQVQAITFCNLWHVIYASWLGSKAYSMKHLFFGHKECICNKFVTNALLMSCDICMLYEILNMLQDLLCTHKICHLLVFIFVYYFKMGVVTNCTAKYTNCMMKFSTNITNTCFGW